MMQIPLMFVIKEQKRRKKELTFGINFAGFFSYSALNNDRNSRFKSLRFGLLLSAAAAASSSTSLSVIHTRLSPSSLIESLSSLLRPRSVATRLRAERSPIPLSFASSRVVEGELMMWEEARDGLIRRGVLGVFGVFLERIG